MRWVDQHCQPWRLRTAAIAILVATLALSTADAARGDAAAGISSELRAAGLPVASVTQESPAGTTVALSKDTDQGLSFDQYKPYLSPDHAAPLPLAHVVLDVPTGNALTGVLAPPGFVHPVVTDSAPTVMVWRLAVFDAVKHAVAQGTQLAGFELDLRSSWLSAPDRTLTAVPTNAAVFPPTQQYAQLMPVDDVKTRVQAQLPAWAQSGNVTVEEDSARERVVTVSVSLAPSSFLVHDVPALRDVLARIQAQLIASGGNIGRTIVKVTDPQTGDPLYLAADDRTWGYLSTWRSPVIDALHSAASPLASQAGTTVQSAMPPAPQMP